MSNKRKTWVPRLVPWNLLLALLVVLPQFDRASAESGPEKGPRCFNRANCPEDLQRYFFDMRQKLAPLLANRAQGILAASGGLVVYEPAGFSELSLPTADFNGITVSPVTVSEDPVTRDTLICNATNGLVAVLPRVPADDPFGWLLEFTPDWMAGPVADEAPAGLARLRVTFNLLAVPHEKAALAQLERKRSSRSGRGGRNLPNPAGGGRRPAQSARFLDTDGDGIGDWLEEQEYGTDPRIADSDGDGLGDGDETTGRLAWSLDLIADDPGWVEPGPGARWITRWTGGLPKERRVARAFSSPIPVPFEPGRVGPAEMRVASDGYVLFGEQDPGEAHFFGVNLPLPWPGLKRVAAPFWDELTISPGNGVWYSIDGGPGARRVVVTWTGAELERDAGAGLDFQMVFSDADGSCVFRYRPADGLRFPGAAFCTIGLQGPESAPARVAFNRSVPVAGPGLAIRFRPAATSPRMADTDGDGFDDGLEASRGWDPLRPENRDLDADGDGLPFDREMRSGTDPWQADTDGDGFTDAEELAIALDPLDPEDAGQDADGDGLSNEEEWCYGTDLRSGDSDGDGLPDGLEIARGDNPSVRETEAGPPERMRTGFRLAESEPAGNSMMLQVGPYRLRGGAFKGPGKWVTLMLPLGRTYEVTLAPREGFVEAPVLSTAIRVNDREPAPGKGTDRWFCTPAIIDSPNQVFGTWSR